MPRRLRSAWAISHAERRASISLGETTFSWANFSTRSNSRWALISAARARVTWDSAAAILPFFAPGFDLFQLRLGGDYVRFGLMHRRHAHVVVTEPAQ